MELDAPDDADVAALRTTAAAKVAGAAAMIAGVLCVVLGAQTFGVVTRWSVYLALTTALQLGLGVAAVWGGARLVRMRGWAAAVAAASLASSALVNGAWVVYALTGGMVSVLALALAPLSALAALGAAACIPVTRRADAARFRLRERGIEVGD